jgi:alanine racemase
MWTSARCGSGRSQGATNKAGLGARVQAGRTFAFRAVGASSFATRPQAIITEVKSWVEISSARLAENLRAVQAVAGDGVVVLAVVKANGYGHDAALVAPILAAAGAPWLGVSDVEEGALVRAALMQSEHGMGTRVLVMCAMEIADADAMLKHDLTPVVWTVEHIAALETAAQQAGRQVAVHLEIDTGMARQGVAVGADMAPILTHLAASTWVRCEGVMSHLSSSEVAKSAVTAVQRTRFNEALEQCVAAGLRPELIHLGNSSAVDEGSASEWICHKAAQLGAVAMVRTGLAVYGDVLQVEGGEGALSSKLKPALTWKTRVADLRTIAAGDTVGYGGTFVATQAMRLALLPVGYADGFRREASSGIGDGWVMVGGMRCAVVGRVSMNLTVVDVTAIADIAVGNEVVLLGEGVSADDHARWCGTIPYEILCGIRGHCELRRG